MKMVAAHGTFGGVNNGAVLAGLIGKDVHNRATVVGEVDLFVLYFHNIMILQYAE